MKNADIRKKKNTQKYTDVSRKKNSQINADNFLYKDLSYKIIGCFYEIRNQYGPGQKEIIYKNALVEKLKKLDLKVEIEKRIPIKSVDSNKILGVYQPDIIVGDKIIIEIKSSNFTSKQDEKQLYFYLKNSPYQVGFIVNFSTPKIFMKRIIYSNRLKHLHSSASSLNLRVSAFTLLELLIIISLIALLVIAALVLLNPLKQIQKSWDGKRKTELSQLRKVLEDWYNDKNCYPTPQQICYDSAQTTPGGTYVCHICGRESTPADFSSYLKVLPCDPQHSAKKYLYQVDNNSCPTWYKIYTNLNITSDPAIAEVGCSDGCGIGNYTGFIYNYGITSPNTSLEGGPGDYACYGSGCTWYDKNQLTCIPNFFDSNCGGQCSSVRSNCVPKP